MSDWPTSLADARERILALEAETERLRAGFREYACTATDHPCGCYEQFLSEKAEIAQLRSERDELLAALGWADDLLRHNDGTIADAITKAEGNQA